jgi:hypothetical protein
MSAAELLVGFLSVLAVSGTIALLGTLSFASKRLGALEDEERCPEVVRWRKLGDRAMTITGVTRCTLREGHRGPHHTKRPDDSSRDHWWEPPTPATKPEPESEEKGRSDDAREVS